MADWIPASAWTRNWVLALAVIGSAAIAKKSPGAAKPSPGAGWEQRRDENGKTVQSLKIEAPSFTEEDQYGYVMPDRYRCDSCRAVLFHVEEQLRKRQPRNRRMKEWEYSDLFEDTCRRSFEGYGIRLVNGENTLSGPGLKREEEIAPGGGAIQMGGESWSKRLGEICRKIVFEKVGEDELYDRFHRKFLSEVNGKGGKDEPGLSAAMCMDELRDCKVGPSLPPKARPTAAEEKPEKAKPAKADAKKKPPANTKRKPATSSGAASTAQPLDVQGTGGTRGSFGADEGGRLDAQSFLRSLAVRHGFTPDEYVAARTTAEWEKLVVAMAGKIFNQFAHGEHAGSCIAEK